MAPDMAFRIIDTMFDDPWTYLTEVQDDGVKARGCKPELARYLAFDFIGGEPLLKTDLIRSLVMRVLQKSVDPKYNFSVRFAISTNGVNYRSDAVQKLVAECGDVLSVGMTIDGTEAQHDSCRVFPDGKGSHHVVEESARLWQEQFPTHGTKVTISPENISQLSESMIYLWEDIGIQHVPANTVFESGWTDQHAAIFKKQLRILKKYLLEGDNAARFHTTLFDETIGFPLSPDETTNSCGGNGKMLFWMPDGSLFNCIRYAPHATKDGIGLPMGHIERGLDDKVVRRLERINRRTSSDDECFYCPVASGCSYCPGAQNDFFGDPNIRAKYICEMHKARVEVSKEFFRELGQRFQRTVPEWVHGSIDIAPYHSKVDLTRLEDEMYRAMQLKVLSVSLPNDTELPQQTEWILQYAESRAEIERGYRILCNAAEVSSEEYLLDIARRLLIPKSVYATRAVDL